MLAELQRYLGVCDAITLLFQPHVEAVLHDLASQTVVYIAGNFSRRELGEPSLLSEIGLTEEAGLLGPYEKTNWDGRVLKSVSVVLRDGSGTAIGVLCINMDVTAFQSAVSALTSLLAIPQEDRPDILFREDWHERINEYVHEWTRARGISVSSLRNHEKKELVISLSRDGAFGGRNAAGYIARVLGMGRATVYKYLSEKTN